MNGTSPKITRIVLLTCRGSDKLILHFDIKSGCHPYTEEATATMEVAANQGLNYVNMNFPGIPLEIISVR